ncbi:FAD-binding oxidoreductase [Rhizobium sp. BE258]|uniref:FAD-binding oxidoreductase n=1 Tax=Rhizobium sp. BE258 TaxID=2817722 RepID=UPI00285C3FB6|nr:FAD-binding oxidoreductase [Rhizobium sp. BE258]MDR7147114.1 FAD/FMN-containing dehydrogenase [Rhizobium sp. BE258]
MGNWTRRGVLVAGSAIAGAVAGQYLLSPSSDPGPAFPANADAPAGGAILNDAGELSPTPVAQHLTFSEPPQQALVDRLRATLADARSNGQPVAASAARHSMGGHSLPLNGAALTLDQDWLEADTAAKTYRVAAGTRWSTIISKLDAIGFSPAVMQSNNDFGVASTFSVNAHGWPVPFSACGSTVRSMKMMTSDGNLLICSRTENADLFNHAMGGYGLFGVITELELDMVPNSLLEPSCEHLAGEDVGRRFAEVLASDPSVQMAYGRLDISLDRFFEDGLLITYRPAADQSAIPAATGSGFISHVSREIFRRQLGSDGVKHMRWWTEAVLNPQISAASTRNSLMNEPVITLDDRDPLRTDILHEYFVSPSRFADFVAACRDVIPASYQQLLNITLRYVNTDSDSVLAYATEPRIAAVMLFSQEKTVRGEADMARMTEALIERVIAIGGSYYLPYRPHARLDQLQRAYPRAADFAAAKRKADPDLLFRNRFWDNYLDKI